MEEKSKSNVHWVYAEFEIGPYTYSISSFAIELAVNTLPIITLSIGGELSTSADVNAVTPERLFTEMAKLAEFQYKPVANFKAHVRPLSGGASQRVEVKNWVVAGIGLTDLSASGKLAIQITLEHPVSKLSTGIITRIPPANTLPDFNAGTSKEGATYRSMMEQATNFVEAFDLAFKAWNSYQRSGADTKAGGSIDAILITNETVQKAFASLIDYTAVKSFPANRTGADVGLAMLTAFANMPSASNLWNFMVSYVLSSTGLSIIPTFDKAGLTVKPADIWNYGTSTPKFNIQDIARITMQPMDMNPLRGVLIQTSQMSEDSKNWWAVPSETSANLSKLGDFAMLIDPAPEVGSVESVGVPWWLEKTAPAGQDNAATLTRRSVEAAKEAGTRAYNETQVRFGTHGGPIAAAFLYERYKQGTGASFLTPVIMANGSTPIYPGQRMGIKDTEFSIYVNQVKHVVDVAARQAYSNWSGTHLRIGKGGPEDKYFGTAHPFYK